MLYRGTSPHQRLMSHRCSVLAPVVAPEPSREISVLSERPARLASAFAPDRIKADTLGLSADDVEAVLTAGALTSLPSSSTGT